MNINVAFYLIQDVDPALVGSIDGDDEWMKGRWEEWEDGKRDN